MKSPTSSPVVDAVIAKVVPPDHSHPDLESLNGLIAVLRSIPGGDLVPKPLSTEVWNAMSTLGRRLRFHTVLASAHRLQRLDSLMGFIERLPRSAWCEAGSQIAPDWVARHPLRRDEGPKTVEITARVIDGRFFQFDGSPLPKLRDGVARVVIPEFMLQDPRDRETLAAGTSVELLPPLSVLRCRIGLGDESPVTSPAFVFHRVVGQHGDGVFVEVVIDEPLVLRTRGGKRAALMPVRCRIPRLDDRECRSLNEAYKCISETFEKWRRSHSGNVFQEFYWLDEAAAKWVELDTLRGSHEDIPIVATAVASRSNDGGTFTRPKVVAAADWSVEARGRRVAIAVFDEERSAYVVREPKAVGSVDLFLQTLQEEASGQGVLLGLDFPIGMPKAYAMNTPFNDFRSALLEVGSVRYPDFLEPSDEPSMMRPFYPASNSGTQADLVRALKVSDFDELRRQCDWKTSTRRAASSLFFTIGAGQVGRAAGHGWREVLQPNLDSIQLWPFDGELETLLARGGTTIVEVYPAASYERLSFQLGTSNSGRKGDQSARANVANQVLAAIEGESVVLCEAAKEGLKRGFETDDDFDAVMALLGMLLVVTGPRRRTFPDVEAVVKHEGWIFGQEWPE